MEKKQTKQRKRPEKKTAGKKIPKPKVRTLKRTKELLLAALRVWELKQKLDE